MASASAAIAAKSAAEAAAKAEAKEIVVEAKAEALRLKEEAELKLSQAKEKSFEREKELSRREERLAAQREELTRRESEQEKVKQSLDKKYQEVDQARQREVEKLEEIGKLSRGEAEKRIIELTERKLAREIGERVRRAEDEIKAQAEERAREILTDTMMRGATDFVAEYTISTVKLPDEEMKGRIIGKEGRNIRTFEDLTGVNLDLDEAPQAVRISCFDSVRREVARVSLEKLIADGRIQPARIEAIVKRTEEEIEKIMYKAGEELCRQVGVYNLPREIVALLGRFKYRTSYGQNMISHTLEETKMGVHLAHELGAKVNVVRLACLLHDIGKVLAEEEGTHIQLAVDLLKKHHLPAEVIAAVAEHHEDRPSAVEGVIIQIADAISASRPGARYEDYGAYVKRMVALEDAAASFAGVEKAYAISAGREVRVIVKPEVVDDALAHKLSHDIAAKIEQEQNYPGTVKVTVIRELRSVGVAK